MLKTKPARPGRVYTKKKYWRHTVCTALSGTSTPSSRRPYAPRRSTIAASVNLSVKAPATTALMSVSGVDMTSHRPHPKLMSWLTFAAAATKLWYARHHPDTLAAAPAT